MAVQKPIDRLLQIMARLRDPSGGCPWDMEQTFATVAPYTVEEAYEVADAIERGDLDDLKDELGDLLLQVVFHARMAEEQGSFAFDDVAEAICDKMVRRHPHVFGDQTFDSVASQSKAWDDIKAVERAKKGRAQSLLDDVPVGLPALNPRCEAFQTRRARGVCLADHPSCAGISSMRRLLSWSTKSAPAIWPKRGKNSAIFCSSAPTLRGTSTLIRKMCCGPPTPSSSDVSSSSRRALAKGGRTPEQSDLEEDGRPLERRQSR